MGPGTQPLLSLLARSRNETRSRLLTSRFSGCGSHAGSRHAACERVEMPVLVAHPAPWSRKPEAGPAPRTLQWAAELPAELPKPRATCNTLDAGFLPQGRVCPEGTLRKPGDFCLRQVASSGGQRPGMQHRRAARGRDGSGPSSAQAELLCGVPGHQTKCQGTKQTLHGSRQTPKEISASWKEKSGPPESASGSPVSPSREQQQP